MYTQSSKNNTSYTGHVHRGDVYFIQNIGPTTGSEQHGNRPAVVVSNELNNKHSTILEIVYLTTKNKTSLPTHVYVNEVARPSIALCEQIHSIDRAKLNSYVCRLKPNTMKEIDKALMISLGIEP